VARANRIRRKDLKRPDEFVTLTTRAAEWGRENQRTLVVAGVAALVVALAVSGFFALRNARRRDANTDLARALNSSHDAKPADAAQQFSQVASRWASSSAGRIAKLLEADANVRAGKEDAAVTGYEGVLAASDMPEYLRQQALLGYGAALEKKGDPKQALAKYSAAAEMDGPYKPQAMLAAARVHEGLGEKKEADALYKKVQQDFPDVASREGLNLKLGAAG